MNGLSFIRKLPRQIILLITGTNTVKTLCCSAVLDEVDILFNDEDFEPVLQSLIRSSPVTAQYLFVTATLPVNIYNKLVEVFPDCEVIMGPGMHRISAGLEEVDSIISFTNCLLCSLRIKYFQIKSKYLVICKYGEY